MPDFQRYRGALSVAYNGKNRQMPAFRMVVCIGGLNTGVREDGIKKCRVGGKKFYPVCPEIWAYKKITYNGRKWYCSWGCMRADTFKPKNTDTFKPKNIGTYEPKKPRISANSKAVVVINEKTGELFAEYPSMLRAANDFCCSTSDAIKKRIATGKTYDGYIFKYKKDFEDGR